MRKRVLFSCLFSLPAIAFAQFNGYDRFLSFEELDKSVGVTGGDISVSGAHYKDERPPCGGLLIPEIHYTFGEI